MNETINATEKTPEIGTPVLAWYTANSQGASRGMWVVATYGDRFDGQWTSQLGKIALTVTHWMPLPPPIEKINPTYIPGFPA